MNDTFIEHYRALSDEQRAKYQKLMHPFRKAVGEQLRNDKKPADLNAKYEAAAWAVLKAVEK